MALILRSPVHSGQTVTLGRTRSADATDVTTHDVFESAKVGSNLANEAPVPAKVADALPVIDVAELLAREQMLVEQAKQVEAARQSAFEEAYAEGRIEGEQEGRRAYLAAQQRLETLAHAVERAISDKAESAHELLVSIAFEAVCKILGDSFTSVDGISALIRQSVCDLNRQQSIAIRISPEDYDLVEEAGAFGIAPDARWQADATMSIGSCVIDLAHGSLDASLSTQVERLKLALVSARNRAKGEA